MNVVIFGLGYVGMTLGVHIASKGHRVYGIDKSEIVLSALSEGRAHFYEEGFDSHLADVIESGRFSFGSVLSVPCNESALYIVTVGTPLVDGVVTLEPLKNALSVIAGSLKENDSVVLRSTVEVGCTRRIAKPILDLASVNYFLGFCPERTLEGVALEELASLPQIVSGIDSKSHNVMVEFFSKISKEVVPLNSVEEAELVKLLNNSERDLKFALANEIALMCDALNISSSNVIRAANYKYPRSDLKFPGPVGGPCLGKDPYILTGSFSDLSYIPTLFKTGRKVNESIVSRSVTKALDMYQGSLPPRVCILGMAFKGFPRTGDVRGSLAIDLIECIKYESQGSLILAHDYLSTTSDILSCGVTSKLEELELIASDFDIVFIQNNHPNYRLELPSILEQATDNVIVYDFWSQLGSIDNPNVIYCALGEN
tara:strand:- start:79 stop:1362 length:1284 start_codon:yes stop_codon:yes gene_type:complete